MRITNNERRDIDDDENETSFSREREEQNGIWQAIKHVSGLVAMGICTTAGLSQVHPEVRSTTKALFNDPKGTAQAMMDEPTRQNKHATAVQDALRRFPALMDEYRESLQPAIQERLLIMQQGASIPWNPTGNLENKLRTLEVACMTLIANYEAHQNPKLLTIAVQIHAEIVKARQSLDRSPTTSNDLARAN